MPDISMCSGDNCEKKETCYRFTAKPGEWQSYLRIDDPANCEMYLESKKKTKSRKNKSKMTPKLRTMLNDRFDKDVDKLAYELGKILELTYEVGAGAMHDILWPVIQDMKDSLDYYASHPSIIKEAYHSNDSGQITCVHTFINHKAVEVLAKHADTLGDG